MIRILGAVVFIFAIFIGVPLLLWVSGANQAFIDTEPFFRNVIIGVFLAPVVLLIVGTFMVMTHRRDYILDRRYLTDPYRDHKDNPYIQHAVGTLIALVQDISHGTIAEPEMYSDSVRIALKSYLEELLPYIQQGYHIHFDFFHNETYTAHLIRHFSESEYIVEVDGIFNYYCERSQTVYSVPGASDALFRTPGRFRLRMVKDNQSGDFILVGFSDTISGVSAGLATE